MRNNVSRITKWLSFGVLVFFTVIGLGWCFSTLQEHLTESYSFDPAWERDETMLWVMFPIYGFMVFMLCRAFCQEWLAWRKAKGSNCPGNPEIARPAESFATASQPHESERSESCDCRLTLNRERGIVEPVVKE